jgi:hypothetical protein
MLVANFVEICERVHFEKLAALTRHLTADQLEADFKQDFFRGYFCVKNLADSLDSVHAYSIVTKGYSTWQHRMHYIQNLWFSSSLSQSEIAATLASIRDFLFPNARKLDVQRIQINMEVNEQNEFLTNWFMSDHAVNLTVKEGWHVFEMSESNMLKFIDMKSKYNETEFRMVKVEEMSLYADAIRDLIREIAVFENMLDQFETNSEKLVRDYANDENKFYHCVLCLDKADNVIGYALYFLSYHLQRGRGCYLEDLYISEKYRSQGLGMKMWRYMVRDCLVNFNVKFMQWSVLDWNKSAIDIYTNFNGVNLTELNKINFIRYTTSRIYL